VAPDVKIEMFYMISNIIIAWRIFTTGENRRKAKLFSIFMMVCNCGLFGILK
jgi:hypothetical protein